MVTSLYSIGSAPSALSIVRVTSARPSGPRVAVPAKMTSSILPPRRVLAPCSPITQASPSTTFDLPEPFGPTTHVTPFSKAKVVGWANDLNPLRVKLFRCTRPPPPCCLAASLYATGPGGPRDAIAPRYRHAGAMSAFTLDELPLPRDLVDDPAAADFIATIEVRNICEELGYGTPDVRVSAERLLASWSDPHAPHRLFVARVDGRIVARGMYHRLLDDDAGACWLDVRVLPQHRGHGIGTALAARLEATARDDKRTHAIVYVVSPDGPGERMHPPTGAGSLPRDNPEVRFLQARGYQLEQIVRASRLPLPIDGAELEQRLAAARARTGAGYRIRVWSGVTPEPFRDDMAVLLTRMSTDAPQGALEQPEDVWTATRVAEYEARSTADGTVMLTAAAQDVSTGRLVGFTQLAVPPEVSAPADQLDTLVLREHRGHALGMLVKLETLAALQAAHPGRPSITTWNADENRHMLNVNESLGFVPMGYEGAWKLEL